MCHFLGRCRHNLLQLKTVGARLAHEGVMSFTRYVRVE
jgi:hypothetical protein